MLPNTPARIESRENDTLVLPPTTKTPARASAYFPTNPPECKLRLKYSSFNDMYSPLGEYRRAPVHSIIGSGIEMASRLGGWAWE